MSRLRALSSGQHGFEVAVEDERAIERPEQLARERDGALEPVAKDLERRAKILGDDRGAARRTRMVARIREARRRLEQHLELEEQLVLPVERERAEPRLALGALLARAARRVPLRRSLYGVAQPSRGSVERRSSGAAVISG